MVSVAKDNMKALSYLKTEAHDHTILGICVEDLMKQQLDRMACIYHVRTGWEALAVMRLMRVDLILTGLNIPDLPLWDLMDRIRVLWPWQKWVLVHPELTMGQEREARIRGALRAIEPCQASIPELCDLATRLRHKSRTPAASIGA